MKSRPDRRYLLPSAREEEKRDSFKDIGESRPAAHLSALDACTDELIAAGDMKPCVVPPSAQTNGYLKAALSNNYVVFGRNIILHVWSLLRQVFELPSSQPGIPSYCTMFHHMVKSGGTTIRNQLINASGAEQVPHPGETGDRVATSAFGLPVCPSCTSLLCDGYTKPACRRSSTARRVGYVSERWSPICHGMSS